MAETQDPELVAPPPSKAAPVASSTMGAAVPVWDPDTKTLRAVDRAHAQQLVEEGYAVGPAAQHEAEAESGASQAKGFFGTAANAATAGLSNLALAYTGNGQTVSDLGEYSERHPYQAGAANFLGFGASLVAGPGSAGLSLLGKLGGRSIGTKIAAHMLVPAGGAAAVQGAAEELTREKLVNDPVHLDQIASSAFSSVLWNALGNTLGYGIGKLPGFLRSKAGNWADWAERTGFHKVKLKKDAAVAPTGPTLQRLTISGEHSAEHSVASQDLSRTESIDDLKERLQTDQLLSTTIKRADSSAEELATKTARATKTSTSGSVVPKDVAPTDVEPVFAWPQGYRKTHKLSVLTRMMKQLLGDDATHLQMWNETTRLSKEIGAAKKAIADGELDAAATAPLLDKMFREKEELKAYLYEAVPRFVDGDQFRPGFQDLDQEYARQSGNLYHDLQDPKFDKAAAAIPKSSKAPRVTTSESEALNTATKSKEAHSIASVDVNSDRVKTDTTTRDFDKEVRQTRVDTKDGSKDKSKFTATIVFPKAPPTYTRVGIKQPFANTDVAQTLIAGSLVPGLGAPSKAAAAYMTGRNSLAWLATHRTPIGNAVGAAGDRLLKYGTPTIQSLVKTAGEAHRDKPYAAPVNVSSYAHAADVLNAAASNPQAVQSYMEQTYPGFHAAYPEAAAQVTTSVIRAARLLNDTVPKRPYAPTLRDTTFRPPRAQQVRMLSRWQVLANPQLALQTGDPQTLQILQEAYPAWYEHQRSRLIRDTQAYRGDVNGKVARNITAFTGAAVNPVNTAAALKRMQATATIPEPNAGQQGGNGQTMGAGPKSTKTANAAANRDDPSFELN